MNIYRSQSMMQLDSKVKRCPWVILLQLDLKECFKMASDRQRQLVFFSQRRGLSRSMYGKNCLRHVCRLYSGS